MFCSISGIYMKFWKLKKKKKMIAIANVFPKLQTERIG